MKPPRTWVLARRHGVPGAFTYEYLHDAPVVASERVWTSQVEGAARYKDFGEALDVARLFNAVPISSQWADRPVAQLDPLSL